MLKGSAMTNALAIFLIIAGISSALVLFAYYNRIEFIQLNHKSRLIDNAFSGINYGIGFSEKIPINQSTEIDLFGNEMDKVQLSKKTWGMFEVITSTAKEGSSSFSKSAIIGSKLLKEEGIALWLADMNKPLSLCGKTELVGTCYLPEAGVKRAYIEGQSFVGAKLVQGETKTSERQLPSLNKEIIDWNLNFFLSASSNDSLLSEDSFLKQDTISNSFANKMLLCQGKELIFADKTISGNVVFKANELIYLDEDSEIEDAIFYAPVIIIEDGFKGKVQLFASDSIYIGENVQLEYPSVVALLSKQSTSIKHLTIDKGASIKGVVVGYTEDETNGMQITINKDVEIEGQVYCQGTLDHKGTIYGSLYAQKLLLKTPSSVYENHLLNAVVDYTKLSPHYVGTDIISTSNVKAIVRWIN